MAGFERDDIYSANNLGLAYLDGSGVPKDPATALQLFKHASEGGHPLAPNNIGRLYFTGEGVKKDVGEAVTWYKLGAERGDSWAASNLGWIYTEGPKQLKDADQSAWYYGLAVALDPYGQNGDAAVKLGTIPDKVKARLIKKLVADGDSAEIPTGSTLDTTIVLLQRRAWQSRNPRQDLF
jgi:TPR repeat protein